MTSYRLIQALVACLILSSVVGTGVVAVAAAQPNVQISSVVIVPSDPAPGENVTLQTTVSNLEGSNETAKITDIYVRRTGTAEEQGRVENIGAIGPGGSVTIPMQATFDSTGQKSLRVHVRVEGENGNQRSYEYPLTVTVEEPDEALLSFTTTEATAGGNTPINLTVANGHNQTITGIQVNLRGDGAVENPERIQASIQPGAAQSFQYNVDFNTVGTQTVTGEVTYKTDGDETRETTESVDIEVENPSIDANLSTSHVTNQSGATDVELTNFGNAVLSDIEITASANGDIVARKLLPDVAPESSQTVTFDVGNSVTNTITFAATYQAAGSTHTTTTEATQILGEIRLTSIESTQTGNQITIEGDAANIGSTDAQSVLVRIPNTDDVTPVSPSGEYFVGAVDASEFATFELTGKVTSTRSAIPIEVTYIVGDERVTTSQQLDIGSTGSSANDRNGQEDSGSDGQNPATEPGSTDGQNGSGGLPLIPIAVVLALVVFSIGGYYWWNR